MEPTPESPLPEDPAEEEAVGEVSLGRKISWILLMLLLVLPAVGLAGFLVVQMLFRWIPFGFPRFDGLPLFWVLLAMASLVAFVLGRAGLRRGWPRRGVLITGWCLVALGGIWVSGAVSKVRRSSNAKAVQGNLRQIQAAADQYYLEYGVIFATYDELVGPTNYIKGINPVAGEDYRSLGPIRQDHVEELRIKLPDGQVISLYPPLDVPDGLQVAESGDLRYETTYRNKVPDGPTRIVRKNGEVVSSGNYVEGHLVGPCWYFGRDLNDPASRPPDRPGRVMLPGQEALDASAKLAVARQKQGLLTAQGSSLMQVRDYATAEAVFTRALAIEPEAGVFERRSDVRYLLGNLEGALADLSESIRLTSARERPASILLKRAWLNRLKNDLPAAAAEFRSAAGARPDDVYYRGDACHAACWLYLVECERGQDQAAAEELARTAAQVDRLGPTTTVWYRLEADLLLGRITEEQLLAKVALPADHSGDANRFQALFFAGMLHQRAGDTAGALDRFERAMLSINAKPFVPDDLEIRRALAAGK